MFFKREPSDDPFTQTLKRMVFGSGKYGGIKVHPFMQLLRMGDTDGDYTLVYNLTSPATIKAAQEALGSAKMIGGNQFKKWYSSRKIVDIQRNIWSSAEILTKNTGNLASIIRAEQEKYGIMDINEIMEKHFMTIEGATKVENLSKKSTDILAAFKTLVGISPYTSVNGEISMFDVANTGAGEELQSEHMKLIRDQFKGNALETYEDWQALIQRQNTIGTTKIADKYVEKSQLQWLAEISGLYTMMPELMHTKRLAGSADIAERTWLEYFNRISTGEGNKGFDTYAQHMEAMSDEAFIDLQKKLGIAGTYVNDIDANGKITKSGKQKFMEVVLENDKIRKDAYATQLARLKIAGTIDLPKHSAKDIHSLASFMSETLKDIDDNILHSDPGKLDNLLLYKNIAASAQAIKNDTSLGSNFLIDNKQLSDYADRELFDKYVSLQKTVNDANKMDNLLYTETFNKSKKLPYATVEEYRAALEKEHGHFLRVAQTHISNETRQVGIIGDAIQSWNDTLVDRTLDPDVRAERMGTSWKIINYAIQQSAKERKPLNVPLSIAPQDNPANILLLMATSRVGKELADIRGISVAIGTEVSNMANAIMEQSANLYSQALGDLVEHRSITTIAKEKLQGALGSSYEKTMKYAGLAAIGMLAYNFFRPNQTEKLFGIAPEQGELYDYGTHPTLGTWMDYKNNRVRFQQDRPRDDRRAFAQYLPTPNQFGFGRSPRIYRAKGHPQISQQETYAMNQILGV